MNNDCYFSIHPLLNNDCLLLGSLTKTAKAKQHCSKGAKSSEQVSKTFLNY